MMAWEIYGQIIYTTYIVIFDEVEYGTESKGPDPGCVVKHADRIQMHSAPY